MNALFQAIMTKIAGSALSTDVGGRIYLDQAPEGSDYPCVVFFVVSSIPDWFLSGKFEDIILQFSIFSTSESSSEISTILTDMRSLFDDCSLTITGQTLINFERGNLTTIMEEVTTPNGTSAVKHYAQEYRVKTL